MMKCFQTLLIVCVLLLNTVIALPAWADAGKFMKTSEYTEVTQAIADLTNPEKTADISPETIQQKLADLRFQKYILETAEARSVCRNETGEILAIYTRSKKATLPTLSYLGAGEITDDDIECVGVYLPTGTNLASGAGEQELTDPVATKFVPGTQVVVTANPGTGLIEFNAPASGSFKAGEIDWAIPALTQEEVAAQTPNAPVD